MTVQTFRYFKDKFDFGKHAGKTLKKVIETEPSYIEWAMDNSVIAFRTGLFRENTSILVAYHKSLVSGNSVMDTARDTRRRFINNSYNEMAEYFRPLRFPFNRVAQERNIERDDDLFETISISRRQDGNYIIERKEWLDGNNIVLRFEEHRVAVYEVMSAVSPESLFYFGHPDSDNVDYHNIHVDRDVLTDWGMDFGSIPVPEDIIFPPAEIELMDLVPDVSDEILLKDYPNGNCPCDHCRRTWLRERR
jgi:hypothetical protein